MCIEPMKHVVLQAVFSSMRLICAGSPVTATALPAATSTPYAKKLTETGLARYITSHQLFKLHCRE